MELVHILSYLVSFAVVLGFGLFAMLVAKRLSPEARSDTEFFLTARSTAATFLIAFSFYAQGIGSWALFSPPQYALYGGILGVVSYAISCGLPFILVAYLGSHLQRHFPQALSLGDFVRWRFGRHLHAYVSLLMVFNMVVALIAEFSAIGDYFELVLGLNRAVITVLIGTVTMIYTMAGGLYVSLVTDRAQALFSIFLIAVLTVYVGCNFTTTDLPPLSIDFPEGTEPGETKETGLGSLFVFPVSLFAATVFSEAPWQRVWASANDKALKYGALIGALASTTAVFIFGFAGLLAVWSGRFDMADAETHGNIVMFSLLKKPGSSTTDPVYEQAPMWILLIVTALAVTMNESAVDSLQNGITDALSAAFFSEKHINYSRTVVVLITIPLMIVGALTSNSVLGIFQTSNMVTTFSLLPVLIGIWDGGDGIVNEWTSLFGCLFAFFSVMVFGYIAQGGVVAGLQHCYTSGTFDWKAFMVGLVSSAVGMALFVACEYLVRICLRKPFPTGTRMKNKVGSEPKIEKIQVFA